MLTDLVITEILKYMIKMTRLKAKYKAVSLNFVREITQNVEYNNFGQDIKMYQNN